MSPAPRHSHHTRADLQRIAAAAMIDHGLEPTFPAAVLVEVQRLRSQQPRRDQAWPGVVDLTALPWCSIDNDDSRDLDQLTVAEPLPDGSCRIRVAVADVDALVPKGSAVDAHAARNTVSVYTSAQVFPMLPEALSTDLTSLNPGQDRLAIVTEVVVAADGSLHSPRLQRAWVHNQAQLAYDAVAAWLIGQGPLPEAAAAVPGLDAQLRTQDAVAQQLRAVRHSKGALEFESFQPRAVFEGERVVGINQQAHNRARQLIEEWMIVANTCTAQFLAGHGCASLRRVVRSPERWQRIVEVAHRLGVSLPPQPDPVALEAFLARRHQADPLRFPDLSLVIIKLMGAGEYVVERAGAEPIGHFGLAERDYTHATAPNRRYPDIITQRMIKAALAGAPMPYSGAELQALALHCTQCEDAARKIERSLRKSEAALYLEPQLGRYFDALVTGRTDTNTWVRLLAPPVEGMLVGHVPALEVGQTLRVQLVATDVERGFIDFEARRK